MHNSEDFITIIHSNGDSWMEFTANGKIDVYSRGGISMATEKDEKAGINFHAHQLNIDVDELNISAKTAINIEQRPDPDQDPIFALKVKDGKFDVQATKGIDIRNKEEFASGDTTFKLKYNYDNDEFEFNPTRKTQITTSDQTISIKGNFIVAGNVQGNDVITDESGSMEVDTIPSDDQPMQYDEMPEMIQELPANFKMLDEEKAKYSDVTETLKTPLRRVPRKQPWKQTENLDPTKYTPEKILYGVEKTEDSEPAYAKNSWHLDTGNANVKVHEDRGGY